MKLINDYEPVIGLEVHAELKTDTKLFCSCSASFGAEPNTQCCPVCMGMPGTLPVLNKKAVDYAVKAGLALNCRISRFSKSDRKNYFYPDLPKAYQISQYDLPLCLNGYVSIEADNGGKRIGITRIHIEEDAGKLIYDEELGTLIDCNRCGVPLIEIVSEPDLRSSEEAAAYVRKLRAVLLYTGVSDCRMNEGSLRCDVNISVRKTGSSALGTRTEIKNINSFAFIQKAIEYEYKRQIEAIEKGEPIIQETRRFDEKSGKTFSMRKKENSNDYRYFPEPDLPPVEITKEAESILKNEIPQLPDIRKKIYMEKYGLSSSDSETLTSEPSVSDYFDEAAKLTRYPKTLANLLISTAKCSTSMKAEYLASIADMSAGGIINSSTAKALMREPESDPAETVRQNNLAQINDKSILEPLAAEIIGSDPKLASSLKNGKSSAYQALVGRIMAKTSGRANPSVVNEILDSLL